MEKNKKNRRTYLILRDILAERIAQGMYRENEKLPSERDLAEDLHTTRLTLRDALFQLEIEGKVFRMDRRGWYVSGKRLVFNLNQDIGFMTNLREQGQEPGTELIFCEEKPASSELIRLLKVDKHQSVYHIQRKRTINQRPVLIEDIYLDASRYPGLQHTNLSGSLSVVLTDIYGIQVKYADIQITPIAFNELHAKSLQVSPGTPGTLITRISYDVRDTVLQIDQEYWLSDVLRLEVRTDNKF